MEDAEKFDIPFCYNPWKFINIYEYGNCNFCREDLLKDKYKLGNIFKNDIEEIWNGEKAQKFRQSILDGKYEFCNQGSCNRQFDIVHRESPDITPPDSVIAPLPEIVSMRYDTNCNQMCVFCKDRIKKMYRDDIKYWNNIIDSKLIPLCSNARMIMVDEVFESEHSRISVPKILSVYPNIQVAMNTIAIAFNQKNYEELNLKNRIRSLSLKLHAATSETYQKIWRKDEFKQAIENLEYACDLRNNGEIRDLTVEFAVNSLNFKEMKQFAKLALKYDFYANFIVTPAGNTNYIKYNTEYAVYNKSSYYYNDFVKITKDNIFLWDNIALNFAPVLKPISPVCIVCNYIKAKQENRRRKNKDGF